MLVLMLALAVVVAVVVGGDGGALGVCSDMGGNHARCVFG